MARPPAKELTERELELMHVFWDRGESTAAEVRDALAASGLDRAYTTVATLVRILLDKNFLSQTNDEKPYRYRPCACARRFLENFWAKWSIACSEVLARRCSRDSSTAAASARANARP